MSKSNQIVQKLCLHPVHMGAPGSEPAQIHRHDQTGRRRIRDRLQKLQRNADSGHSQHQPHDDGTVRLGRNWQDRILLRRHGRCRCHLLEHAECGEDPRHGSITAIVTSCFQTIGWATSSAFEISSQSCMTVATGITGRISCVDSVPKRAPDHSGQSERCFTHGDREFTEFCNIQHLISNKLDPVHRGVSARSKPQVSLPVHKS